MVLTTPMRLMDADEGSLAIERRRGLRIAQSRPIKIFDPGNGRYVGGKTRDVSAAGLRIELPRSAVVFEGKLINIHVGLSDQGEVLANRRGMIPARIIWVRRFDTRDSEKAIVAGIEFLASIAARLDAA